MHEVFIQSVGLLGLAVFALSFQAKENRTLFLMQFLGSSLFCLQYLLMGAVSGCLSLVVNLIRNALLLKYRQWAWVRSRWFVLALLAALLLVLIFTWSGPLDLFVFAASVGSTIGNCSNHAQKIRLANLLCVSPCWFIYDAINLSVGGMLNDALTLLSIIISIWRYGWKSWGKQ